MTKIYSPNDPRSRMIPMTRSSSIPRSTLHKYVPWNLVHSLHQCSARSPEITLAAIVAAQDLWTGIMQSSTRHLQHGIIRCHDLREAEVNQLQAILAMAINMALLNSHHQREMGWPWWLPLQDTSLIYIYIYYTYIIHILYIYYTYIIHTLYIYYTYIIHILYIYYTYIIHLLYIYYTSIIHLLYIYYTSIIHYIYLYIIILSSPEIYSNLPYITGVWDGLHAGFGPPKASNQ